jgi:hypothetical protein
MGLGSAHLPFIIAIDLLRATDTHALLSCVTFDSLVCSPEAMVRCSPLSEVVAANMEEVENVDRVIDATEVVQTVGERPQVSDGEGHISSPNACDDLLSEGASDDKNSWTNYFGSSTITVIKIKDMVEKDIS